MPQFESTELKTPRTDVDQLIEEFLDYLQIERNCSPLTLRNYHHYLKRFSQWLKKNFPKAKLSSIDLEIIKRYRVFLARFIGPNGTPLSRSTQGYHMIAFRSFLKWLAKNDIECIAPEKIEIPKRESQPFKYLNTEQIERLLSQPKISMPRGLRDKAILEVLFSTGLRVSELVSLNKDQIDLKRKEFGVIGKGKRSRVVFLSDRAAKWLEKYLSSRTDNWKPLFVRVVKDPLKVSNGEKMRLTSRTIQRIVKKYVRKAKIPIDATTHSLRHSFATDLLRAGADIRSVQEMLGHKNISTTQIYTHITNKQLHEIHKAFHGRGK